MRRSGGGWRRPRVVGAGALLVLAVVACAATRSAVATTVERITTAAQATTAERIFVGTVSAVTVNGVHTIVLLIAREPAGQKDPSMPEVKQAITNNLKSRKEQLLQAAYLGSIRNHVNIVNLVAQRVLDSQAKAPSLAPKAPTAKP